MVDFNKRIFVGITSTAVRRKENHWKEQLKEVNLLGIKKIALFLETLSKKKRKELYDELEKSCVKEIPLVHLREQDFTEKEIIYFYKKYKTKLFNCHESGFDKLYRKFPGLRKNILLELNYNDKIENKIEPSKMGGFCIDLSHFKVAKERHNSEYSYILKHFKNTKFQANHLNGYGGGRDLHFVTNKNQFNFVKELPKKIFGRVIALEVENSIKKQLEFKKYLVRILNRKFN